MATVSSNRLAPPLLIRCHIPDPYDSCSFRLQQYDLDDCPDYYALSYTWGEACRTDIELTADKESGVPSDHSFILYLKNFRSPYEPANHADSSGNSVSEMPDYPITKNLEDTLQQLAVSGYIGKWLWIDTICIDQQNGDEKAIQVALMGDIYSRAASHHMARLKLLRKLNLRPPSGDWRDCWESYLNFCRRRRWFSRIWIVQEVVLARSIVVQCGTSSISWENVETLGRMIQILGWQSLIALDVNRAFGRAIGDEHIRLTMVGDHLRSARESLVKHGPAPADHPATQAFGAFEIDAQARWFLYFQKFLYMARPYSATDPRDKIFGLLGIAQQALPDGVVISVQPEYSADYTVASLYVSIASMLLKEVPRLATLSFIEDPGSRKVKNLPSWVPDWTVNLTPTPLTMIRHQDHGFDCCHLHRLIPSPRSIQEQALEVQAAYFDRVVEVSLPMWDMMKTSNIVPDLDICQNITHPYLDTDQDLSEMLCRTLITNSHEGKPAAPTILSSFKAWARNRIAHKLTLDILSIFETDERVNNITLNKPHLISQLSFNKFMILSHRRHHPCQQLTKERS
ncbi:uncharacterized protein PAC_05346 [Phialocephala subalpina]|uniref:Heterokaryon incompatibility domain-containing protein n=1 Tax=Phialocephala subalpina TaxID=576137 RepID=A0A1L7WRQ4_9HELO|nr:uncharacterized protein PAC_05346 [Phialocephala subalpina]